MTNTNIMEHKIIDTKYHSIDSTTWSNSHQKLADLSLIFSIHTYRVFWDDRYKGSLIGSSSKGEKWKI